MLQALGTALAGYAARLDDLGRLAERIRDQRSDANLAGDMVAVMANQRGAEANLAVARVVDETGQSLIHVIA